MKKFIYLYRYLVNWIKRTRTNIRKRMQLSDYSRWKKLSSFDERWDDRTIKMAKHISADSSVLEFGAGRLILKKHLKGNFTYTPSDISKRDDSTIVCDLNKRPLPDFKYHDYIVFSGVVEYVIDLPKLIHDLKNVTDIILVSYATVPENTMRAEFGWVNHYTRDELLELFKNEEYELIIEEKWNKQHIFQFKRKRK